MLELAWGPELARASRSELALRQASLPRALPRASRLGSPAAGDSTLARSVMRSEVAPGQSALTTLRLDTLSQRDKVRQVLHRLSSNDAATVELPYRFIGTVPLRLSFAAIPEQSIVQPGRAGVGLGAPGLKTCASLPIRPLRSSFGSSKDRFLGFSFWPPALWP